MILKELLREIYEEGRRNDEQEQDHNKKMLEEEAECCYNAEQRENITALFL